MAGLRMCDIHIESPAFVGDDPPAAWVLVRAEEALLRRAARGGLLTLLQLQRRPGCGAGAFAGHPRLVVGLEHVEREAAAVDEDDAELVDLPRLDSRRPEHVTCACDARLRP